MKVFTREAVRELVSAFVRDYAARWGDEGLWREPLVGFAAADSPYIRNLPEIVTPNHRLPEDFLPEAVTVISYFIPFTEALGHTNRSNGSGTGDPDPEQPAGQPYASRAWADAYAETNRMMAELDETMVSALRNAGRQGAVPHDIGLDPETIMSPWSQRHIAYAAGLGTFGLNNLLITEQGCCGRFHSIVTDAPFPEDPVLTEERCLFRRDGSCGVCAKRCFSGALTTEGFDRKRCYKATLRNAARYGEDKDVCGKCNVDLPCSYGIPQSFPAGGTEEDEI